MNKIILSGRLTRNPEVRYSQGENPLAIARFSLAVERRFKRQGESETDFFNCTAFGKQAEFVEKYLKQGTKMLVTGRLQNENYTNKEGQKVYGVQIIVDELEFAESRTSAKPQAQQQTQKPTQAPSGADGFMNIPTGLEDELPFA